MAILGFTRATHRMGQRGELSGARQRSEHLDLRVGLGAPVQLAVEPFRCPAVTGSR
jgi:hypothetical protein